MKLSVIILNYNVRYFLELCLISVERALIDLEAEIIVVDNASNDGSIAMVRSKFPQVMVIVNSDNVGFAMANNQGVATAQGEYVCILNPDTVVPEVFFKELISYADSIENLGIVGCQLIDGTGNYLPESKRNVPTARVAIKKLMGNSNHYYAQHVANGHNARVEILVGAMMLLKKSVFNEVNGFDEDYFMYAEDVDLSYKVLQAGYENHYKGSSTIIHFKGESTIKDDKYLKRFYGSMQIFYKKHFRKNRLFDAMVWTGIRVLPRFQNPIIRQSNKCEKAILVSRDSNYEFQELLGIPLSNEPDVILLQPDSLYIFDLNHIDIKDVIRVMSGNDKNLNAKFRFFVPSSRFMIGSDSVNGRGEIVILS